MAAVKAAAGPPLLSGPVSLEPPSLDREPDESESVPKDDSPAGNDEPEEEEEEEEEERTSGVSELGEDDSTTTALDTTAESGGAAPASTEEGSSSEVVDVKMDYENIRIVSHVKSRRSSGGDDSDEDKPRMSRFKGVCWYRQRRKWQASIYLSGGKKKHLGYFESEVDAAKAYDRAAALIHGEDSAVYNFDPTTGKLNPTAKRRLPGSSADRAYTPRVRLPQAVQVRPPPPPLPAGLLAVGGLPVPLLPPTPPLRSAPSTASPLGGGGGVLRHTLLTTDQPLPPPSLHRLLDSTGASDPSASGESTSGQVARSRRPNAGQKRLRDDEVEAFEDDEDEDMEDDGDGGRSRQRRRHQQLQPEQDDDDEEWTPSMSRRRRASASTPVSLRDDTRLSSPPPPAPPAAPPVAPPAPPLQLAFPPLQPLQETTVTLPAPDPTTPQLILVAGLLLEMIVTTRDQDFKARLKKLLKAVAKGCTAVRVIVGAAADRWDLKEDAARWADVLELLLESVEDGTFD